jgi:CubicO group peptidase (beta-lactamase class C family)
VDLPARQGQAARRVQSVPGGTHWGGGVSISARDQARIAQMLLDGGVTRHNGQERRLLSAEWVQRMQAPGPLASFYGLLTWLNPQGQTFPGASPESWFMVGAGGNYVWVEPAHHAVVVVRWIDSAHFTGFVSRVAEALQG